MTIHRRLNRVGKGGHFSTWYLIETLLDAGWTVPMSGSGTGGVYSTSNVYNMSQTIYPGGSVPSNGIGVGSEPWGIEYCWIVLEDPAGNRQLLLQRRAINTDANDGGWRVYYSPGGIFGAGQTPGTDWDEDTIPEATDKGVESEFYEIFNYYSGDTVTHVAADDLPSPSGEYGFCCVEFKATNKCSGSLMFDDLRDVPVGRPHALTLYCPRTTYNPFELGYFFHLESGNIDMPGTVIGAGTEGQTYTLNCYYLPFYGYSVTPESSIPSRGGVGVDGKERAFPAVVISSGAQGYMGTSRWVRLASVSRGYPNTGSTKQYLFVGDVILVDLWDGTTVPASV